MKTLLPNVHSRLIELTKKIPLQVVVFGQTLLIVILIVLLPLILLSIKKDKNNNSKASTANGTATISLSPSTSSLVPNTRQNVDILVNTGQERVDGVQAIISFTGSVPSDLTFSSATVSGLSPVVNSLETISNGKKLSLAFITNNPLQAFTTSSALVKIGTISFTVPASGSMTTTFDPSLTTSIQNGTSQDILKTPEQSTYTFAQGPGLPGQSGQASLTFDTLTPPNPQIVGSNFEVNIIANTASQKISGVDAQVSFDPKLVEIVKVEKSSNTPFISFPELNFNNTTGKVYVSGNIGTAANPTPVIGSNVAVAKITGRTKAATSSTTLQFVFNPNDRNDSNLVLFIEQKGQEPADILATVQGQELIAVNKTNTPTPVSPTPGPTFTLTPSPTATFTPSATPTMTPAAPVVNTIQFGLQGKSRDDANKSIQLDVSIKSVQNNTTATNTVTTNTTGQGQVTAVPDDYVLLVKAPGYLARKIGSVANPVRLGGTSQVNLTSTPLLGGDFNNDGEVNEIDYTLNFLTSFRSANSVVDLDSSGNVNNLDFAIMRSNWALQSETLQ